MPELTLMPRRTPSGVVLEAFRVRNGQASLGRGAHCDWVLPDPQRLLSKRHCEFVWRNGGWMITDLSSNGTTVGGRTLAPGVPHALQNGDRIGCGSYELDAQIGAAVEDEPTRAGFSAEPTQDTLVKSMFPSVSNPFDQDRSFPGFDAKPPRSPAFGPKTGPGAGLGTDSGTGSGTGLGTGLGAGTAGSPATSPTTGNPFDAAMRRNAGPASAPTHALGSLPENGFGSMPDSPLFGDTPSPALGRTPGSGPDQPRDHTRPSTADRGSPFFDATSPRYGRSATETISIIHPFDFSLGASEHGLDLGLSTQSPDVSAIPPQTSGLHDSFQPPRPASDLLPEDWDRPETRQFKPVLTPGQPAPTSRAIGNPFAESETDPASPNHATTRPDTAPNNGHNASRDTGGNTGRDTGPGTPPHPNTQLGTPFDTTPNTPRDNQRDTARDTGRDTARGNTGPNAGPNTLPGIAARHTQPNQSRTAAPQGLPLATPTARPGTQSPDTQLPATQLPGTTPRNTLPPIASAITPPLVPGADAITDPLTPDRKPAQRAAQTQPPAIWPDLAQPDLAQPEPARPDARHHNTTSPHAPAAMDHPAIIAAFMRGAGLPGMTTDVPEAFFEDLGRTFRAFVVGLRRTMIARAEVKGEFRIDQTMIQPFGNNPLKFAVDDDDALSALLGVGRRTGIAGADAVADALHDIQVHEMAITRAMEPAIQEFLAANGPEAVLGTLSYPADQPLSLLRRAKAWSAYARHHQEMMEVATETLDGTFGRAFGRAYEAARTEIESHGPARTTATRNAPNRNAPDRSAPERSTQNRNAPIQGQIHGETHTPPRPGESAGPTGTTYGETTQWSLPPEEEP